MMFFLYRLDRSLSLPSSGFQKTLNTTDNNITVYKIISRDPKRKLLSMTRKISSLTSSLTTAIPTTRFVHQSFGPHRQVFWTFFVSPFIWFVLKIFRRHFPFIFTLELQSGAQLRGGRWGRAPPPAFHS